jgi:hypothetical protein
MAALANFNLYKGRLLMKAFFGFIGAMACFAFLAWAGTRIYYNIQFGLNCEDYISQAASSPDPAIAVQRLDAAIAYAERNGMTAGNTGVLFNYPTNDIGFWYRRMVDSRAILSALPKNDAPLEISNTMMRVRETLVHTSGAIAEPKGIGISPHNVAFAWWGWLSFMLALIFGGGAFIALVNE